MIHIFFVPGMFGSTVEYVLKNYTKEYEKIDGSILSDGSMHSFKKECHVWQANDLVPVHQQPDSDSINTIIYPFKTQHLHQILEYYQPRSNDQCLLVHAQDLRSAELNCLFQYHKVAYGVASKLGLDIFYNSNQHNVKSWNQSYTSWQDMQLWELREWFSIFYPEWVNEWIHSTNLVNSDWKIISNLEILNDTENVLRQIINFCNLTEDRGLDNFVQEWRHRQQYIVDEYQLLDQIVNHTTTHQSLNWKPINIVAESIVQQRLRAVGYEIRCDGLNVFPTDSKTLYNLLEPV
jgi:hypothetical protein